MKPLKCVPLLVLVLGSCSLSHTDPPHSDPTRGEFARSAAEDRILNRDLPDHQFLDREDTVYVVVDEGAVRRGVDTEGVRFSEGLEPPIRWSTKADMWELAAREDRIVSYVTVGGFDRVGDVWKLWIQLSLARPYPWDLPPSCCCLGHAEFTLEGGEFVFQEWDRIICA